MSELLAVEVAVSPTEKFTEFLLTKGKRLTQERKNVVDEVFASHQHFDPDQLINHVSTRKDARRVSRSTVYRTIALLEEAGLLRKVARANGRDVYEHDYGYPQHGHLICQKCGSMIEFSEETISKIIEKVAAEHEFRLTGHRLEVYGNCSKCSRPMQRRHDKLNFI